MKTKRPSRWIRFPHLLGSPGTVEQITEQIQEADAQLCRATDTAARLALFLADNVVELLLHGYARREMCLWLRKQNGENLTEDRETLTDFAKTAEWVAENEQGFSQEDLRVAIVAHQLRNEAYHSGVVRKGLISMVAQAQLAVARRLFPMVLEQHPRGRISEGFGTPVHVFVAALRDDLIRRCEAIVDLCQSMTVRGEEAEDKLRWHYAWFLDEANKPISETPEQRLARIYEQSRTDKVVSYAMLDRWKEEARGLVVRSPGVALTLYWRVDDRLWRVEEVMDEAHGAYEEGLERDAEAAREEHC